VLGGAGLAVLGGVLWVLASQPIGLWPLGWIAAVPTLLAIDRAQTPHRAGLWGALTAFTFTVGGFHWMIHLLEVNAQLPGAVAGLAVMILGAFHGLLYYIGARLIRGLRDRRRGHAKGPWPLALVGALGFIVIEIALWTPFPFSLALGQADVDRVRFLTGFVGPSGITALMIGAAGTLLEVLGTVGAPTGKGKGRVGPRGRIKPIAAYVVAFAIVAIGSRRDIPDGPTRSLMVGVVQPNERVDVPHTRKARLDLLAGMQRATAELEAQGADLVVWSEVAYPFDLPRDLDHDLPETSPFRMRRGFTIPVVVGMGTNDNGGRRWNSAVMLERDGRFTGRHDKVHQMVGSEYNPLIVWFPPAEKLMPAGAGSYAAGDHAVALETTIDGQPLRLAVAICLEDVMPDFGRELAALEPDLLVNLTNDSWFGGGEPAQHEALARFRPVEIGVPMVRAVNTGPSSVLDRDGRFVARLDQRDEGGAPQTLLATLELGPRAHSFYAGLGGFLIKVIAGARPLWGPGPALPAWWARRRERRSAA